MFTRVVTKAGELIWLRQNQPIFGRHEIARTEFQKWELRQALQKKAEE